MIVSFIRHTGTYEYSPRYSRTTMPICARNFQPLNGKSFCKASGNPTHEASSSERCNPPSIQCMVHRPPPPPPSTSGKAWPSQEVVRNYDAGSPSFATGIHLGKCGHSTFLTFPRTRCALYCMKLQKCPPVLRLESGALSVLKYLRQTTNEYATPTCSVPALQRCQGLWSYDYGRA